MCVLALPVGRPRTRARPLRPLPAHTGANPHTLSIHIAHSRTPLRPTSTRLRVDARRLVVDEPRRRKRGEAREVYVDVVVVIVASHIAGQHAAVGRVHVARHERDADALGVCEEARGPAAVGGGGK